jgi:hypothetical protein
MNVLALIHLWAFGSFVMLVACAHYLQKIYRLLEARK